MNSEISHGISRRDVLRGLAAAGLGLAGAGAAEGTSPPKPLIERTIPKSGERIPAVGLGTWQTFDVGAGEAARAGPREVLKLFAAAGARVVDSSPMYGRAETVVGDLAAELNLSGKLFLATKVWTSGQRAGIAQMERSMQRLHTTKLDLMQVHNLMDWETHLDTLAEWKKAGKVRYVGITHYTESAYDELEEVMASAAIDFVQFNYNIVRREAERRLLPLAAEHGIAVLVNRPFMGAGLFNRVRGKQLPPWAKDIDCASWAQFFLKFILSHPAVTCAIPATSKPKHALDNLGGGRGRLPDANMRERMADYVAKL